MDPAECLFVRASLFVRAAAAVSTLSIFKQPTAICGAKDRLRLLRRRLQQQPPPRRKHKRLPISSSVSCEESKREGRESVTPRRNILRFYDQSVHR
jgi:hypothetical protein